MQLRLVVKVKFSIIMPVYNGEKYITKSIQSVLSQTCEDWELIIIDDGSKDKSFEIIRAYAQKDSRIRFCKQENAGVSEARNKALDLVQGDYVIFLDADDELHKNALEIIAKPIQSNHIDIVVYNASRSPFGSVKLIPFTVPFSESQFLINSEELKVKYIYSALLSDVNFGFIWNLAVRASVIDNIRFRKDIIICEDLLFDIEMYTRADSILCIPDYLYYYRDNPEGCVNNFKYKKIEDLKKVFDIRKSLIEKYKLKGNYELILKSFCGNIIYFYLGFIQNRKLCKEYVSYIKNDEFIVERFRELTSVKLPNTFPSVKFIFGNVIEREMLRNYILLRKFAKRILKK